MQKKGWNFKIPLDNNSSAPRYHLRFLRKKNAVLPLEISTAKVQLKILNSSPIFRKRKNLHFSFNASLAFLFMHRFLKTQFPILLVNCEKLSQNLCKTIYDRKEFFVITLLTNSLMLSDWSLTNSEWLNPSRLILFNN